MIKILYNEKLDIVKQNMTIKETFLFEKACKSSDGISFREDTEDIRPIFFRDTDKIIHSTSYTRYIDKTQVFPFEKNDHITHRVLHVQLVSKIAKTIGRALKLNEDLIEAIALGHDIGHSPFGHSGEKLLDAICQKEGIGFFCHNSQSVRLLKDIENINISLQTLDGILAHNGEILQDVYKYNPTKTKEEFLKEVENVFKTKDYNKKIIPMTLEGCVVKISDVIAYIGRDIEDAIRLGIVVRSDVPQEITQVLGNTNSEIVNTLILDLIENSYEKDYLKFSNTIYASLKELLEWNYKYIYNSEEAHKKEKEIEILFYKLYESYLEKIKRIDLLKPIEIKEDDNASEKTFYEFINQKTDIYRKNTVAKRIIIDYIAGQTDEFFLNEAKKIKKLT